MAHIKIQEGLPGIRGLMAFRPKAARALNALVDELLHEPNSLTGGERELIATYVSALNDCHYCQSIHGAVAAAHLDGDEALVTAVKLDIETAPLSGKMRALLRIAAQVQKGGKHVSASLISAAKDQGATDTELHDTVLIAAAFCMFNRYVDGLGTTAPTDQAAYRERGKRIAAAGYQEGSKDFLEKR